jgi:hypothetical protein
MRDSKEKMINKFSKANYSRIYDKRMIFVVTERTRGWNRSCLGGFVSVLWGRR